MKAGDRISLIGTVVSARSGTASTGSRYVKATLNVDDGSRMDVVWWDAATAASEGQRVSVAGTVRTYNGKLELNVSDTRLQRPLPHDDRARVVGYLLECIEAEATSELSSPLRSSSTVLLTPKSIPMFTERAVDLPNDQATTRWAGQRMSAIGETVVVGYPLVVGSDSGNGTAGVVMRPLFINEVKVRFDEQRNVFSVARLGDSLDVNPAAIDLMGLTRDERDECLAVLGASPEFDEAKTALDQLRIGLATLAEVTGIDTLRPEHFDPAKMGAPTEANGVCNAAALFVTTGSSQITRKLTEELEELLRDPVALASGPVGVLLGQRLNQPMQLPRCHPIIVPSTLRQDQAIHSAMTSPFTVVTGPPGTGKSQVLVNVVAAAAAAGQTVLFASKNNKAVDVVFDRIRDVSPHANVLRAGAASRRQELAAAIGAGLNREGGAVDVNTPRAQQATVGRTVDQVLARIKERMELELLAVSLQSRLDSCVRRLPAGADIDINISDVTSRMSQVDAALNEFNQKLPWLRRGQRRSMHRERVERAEAAIRSLNVLLNDHRLYLIDAATVLTPVTAKPSSTGEPLGLFSPARDQLAWINEALGFRHQVAAIWDRINREFPKWKIENDLGVLTTQRLEAGRALLDATWDANLSTNPAAVDAARSVQSNLQAATTGGAGARQARNSLPDMLAAFPAWGVTNLSAGTNFPLKAGMFDLVVIDEASQCDLASAIPLLYRAKRALIIGDQKQLIHITQLGRARNDAIAERWHLTDAQRAEFDFRAQSTFAVAASKVGTPLLLDLHFRSQAAIIGFSNRRFYEQQLEVCSIPDTGRGDHDTEPTVSWLDVPGDAERGKGGRSWRNSREARAVADELARILPELRGNGQSVGVVTPYRAQAEQIRDAVTKVLGRDAHTISIDTAHRFQGDERDVILFSPVVGPSMSKGQVAFANDPNLVNVALTRARHRLRVVGNRSACLRYPNMPIGDFATYVARLEASAFDSPLELQLHEALLARGVNAIPGHRVGQYRLDLAVDPNGTKLDIECDGAPFHTNDTRDAARDEELRRFGWTVLRFSGRELSRNVDECADRALKKMTEVNS